MTSSCSLLTMYAIQGYNIDRQKSNLTQYNDTQLSLLLMQYTSKPETSPLCSYFRYTFNIDRPNPNPNPKNQRQVRSAATSGIHLAMIGLTLTIILALAPTLKTRYKFALLLLLVFSFNNERPRANKKFNDAVYCFSKVCTSLPLLWSYQLQRI